MNLGETKGFHLFGMESSMKHLVIVVGLFVILYACIWAGVKFITWLWPSLLER